MKASDTGHEFQLTCRHTQRAIEKVILSLYETE